MIILNNIISMTNMTINHISLIYTIQLNSINDTCPICREHLLEKCLSDNCLTCISNNNLIVGTCNHGYHKCCLTKWFSKNSFGNYCALCDQKIKI